MRNKIYKILVKLALRLHNFSYRLSTKLAVKTERNLHPKHRVMNYHKFFIDNIELGDMVLDIGCGNGALTFDLAKKAKEVIGIDKNKENIKLAREKYSSPNIKYYFGDVTKYIFPSKFDAIILSNVLEHISNRVEFLKKIKELAPKLLIRVPMINRDWITLYKKELEIEWRLDPTHFTEYTLESFKEELRKSGLKIQNYNIRFGEIWAIGIKNG
ncbi:MAG: class I SAM-dependent methyltransferase [Candidatus Omnitrophica bacterium]|nr:class I SAM-dependent methyltransferase [Candidatus Omnitrophota bacterium]